MVVSCKTVASAYVGSNPTPATTSENGPLSCGYRGLRAFLRVFAPCCIICRFGAPCRSGDGHIADGSGAGGAVHGTAGSGCRPSQEQWSGVLPTAGDPIYESRRGCLSGPGPSRLGRSLCADLVMILDRFLAGPAWPCARQVEEATSLQPRTTRARQAAPRGLNGIDSAAQVPVRARRKRSPPNPARHRVWPVTGGRRAGLAALAVLVLAGCAGTATGPGAGPRAGSLPGAAIPAATRTAPARKVAGVRTAMVSVGTAPFGVAVSPGGRFVFVSRAGSIAVLRAGPSSSPPSLVRSIPVPDALQGETLTRDGRYLLVAAARVRRSSAWPAPRTASRIPCPAS